MGERKKLKTITNKRTIASIIALTLILTISSQMLLSPTATAHTPAWNIPSFAYVAAQPSPVGVGQQVQVYMWVDAPMPSAAEGNDIRRHDYKLTINRSRWKNRSENMANHLGYNWRTILCIRTRPSRHLYFTI